MHSCILCNTFARAKILQAAEDVRAGRDAFIDIFERIKLSVSMLAVITKEMKQRRASKSFLHEFVTVDRNIFRK